MWEGLVRHPHGRLSVRRFMTVFATLLVACFVYTLAVAPTAHAADATWKDKSIVYSGRTYTGPTTATASDGSGLTPGTIIYRSVDTASTPNKAYVIYFSPGTSPPSETTARYSEFDYANGKYSNSTNRRPISIQPTASSTDGSGGTGGKTTSCSVTGGLGWIVCPVSNMLASTMDYLYGVISDFLRVQPLQTTQDNALYRAWDIARNLANICFVIGFLIMIYGQITGGLMSNYTVKKVLPRVAVAALLVNLSYWICAIGIDISNVLGYSVQDLFTGVRNSLVGADESTTLSWTNLTEMIVTGGTATVAAGVTGAAAIAATGGSIVSAIFLLLPALVGVITAALIAVIVLAMRQALITLFVIIAPLAFVAYLLPNTEKWFHKWRDVFMTLLFMFPIFSVIFGASQLAGTAIINGTGNTVSITMVILGYVVQVAPLVVTPLIVRFSGSLLGRFAGMLNNPNKGIIDRTRNWANPRAEMYKNRNLARQNDGVHRYGTGRLARRFYRGDKEREERNEGYKIKANNRVHEFKPYENPDDSRFAAVNRYRNARNERYANRTGYGHWVDEKRDAELRHKELEADHDKHYYAAAVNPVAGSVGARRAEMMKNAHKDEGKSKVYQESITNAAERDLQEEIRDDRNLRKIRTQSVVDAGLADRAKKLVDAKGAIALQHTIMASPDLTQQAIETHGLEKKAAMFEGVVQKNAEVSFQRQVKDNKKLKQIINKTVEYEKEAGEIEKTLKDRAEQRWERISTDTADPEYRADLRQARLYAVEASDDLKQAQAQWTSLVEGIRARGADAPTIDGHIERSIAGNIKQLGQDIKIEESRAGQFQYEQKFNLSSELKENEALRMYAGADKIEGATRVYAKAKADVVQSVVDEVKTNRTLTSEMTRRQLHTMLYDGVDTNNEPVTVEMRQAAMYELLQEKGNNMDAQEIRDAVAKMGVAVDDDGNFFEYQRDPEGRIVRDARGFAMLDRSRPVSAEEAGKRRDWQQFFEDAAKGSPHNIGTLSGTNRSEFKSGNSVDTSRDAFFRDVLGGKFKPQSILKYDVDELKIFLSDMRKPDGEYSKLSDEQKAQFEKAFTSAVHGLQTHATYKGDIDDRNRGVMNEIVAEVNPDYLAGYTADGHAIFNVDEDKALLRADQRDQAADQFRTPIIVPPNTYTDRNIEHALTSPS